MIYNEKVSDEYGKSTIFLGVSPIAFQPNPTSIDYKNGFFRRWFSMRANAIKATEINPETSTQVDQNLYKTVSLVWQISGPRKNEVVNGIIEQNGVENLNVGEIERVNRETEVDLSKTLTNPLEFWRGY